MDSIVDRNAASADIDMQMIEVDGQLLRVAIRREPKGRPPLLMFNGIGANSGLAKPFLTPTPGMSKIIASVCSKAARRFPPGTYVLES
jgi:hypothetical protein